MKKFGFLIILSVLIFSCNKTEGKGGTSSIVGIITAKEYKNNGDLKATYAAADEDVFIIYGKDNTNIGDKTATSYNGSYRFDNLTVGTYKVFSYSKCKTCDSNSKEVILEVSISKNGEVITVPELIIEK